MKRFAVILIVLGFAALSDRAYGQAGPTQCNGYVIGDGGPDGFFCYPNGCSSFMGNLCNDAEPCSCNKFASPWFVKCWCCEGCIAVGRCVLQLVWVPATETEPGYWAIKCKGNSGFFICTFCCNPHQVEVIPGVWGYTCGPCCDM